MATKFKKSEENCNKVEYFQITIKIDIITIFQTNFDILTDLKIFLNINLGFYMNHIFELAIMRQI